MNVNMIIKWGDFIILTWLVDDSIRKISINQSNIERIL